LRRFLLGLAFFYPPIYSFFCYRRKRGRREEFEEKARVYYANQGNPRSLKKIIRGVFELRGVRKMMRYLIPWMDRRFIERSVKVEGLQHVDGMLKQGRGVLLMAGHIGVPHLAFNALRVMGYDVILLSGVTPKKARYPKIRYYDTPDRTIFVHDFSLSDTYQRKIVETLASGKIIYYDGDAAGGRVKERIRFLGQEMEFPTGMLRLAHQANAAVIPFIHLFKRGKMRLIFEEPSDRGWEEGKEAYRRIVREFAERLEAYVLRYPEQYLGIYGPTILDHHYRTTPKGSSPIGKA
jgi:KDO2-lipid IV(A) lauroyltransferase